MEYQAMEEARMEIVVDVPDGVSGEWKPQKDAKWDFVWHDIWMSINSNNLKEMGNLKRRFARRTPLQMCWGEWECKRQKRRERNSWW